MNHAVIACLLLGSLTGTTITAADAPPDAAGRERIEADWCRQEQVFRQGDAASAKAVDGVLERGRLLCADLVQRGSTDAAAVRMALEEAAAERARLGSGGTAEAWRALYCKVRWTLRGSLLAHPRLAGGRLLYVQRQWPNFNHQCAHRVGEAQIPGANLCVLTGLDGGGTVREVLPADMARGGIGRPDLSFDATRIVFPYARPRAVPTRYPSGGGHGGYDPDHPADSTSYRGGACHMYDIYSVGIDGGGLARLTSDDAAEDTEPCWMPDGRVLFTSSREGRMVQCGDWALVFGLWSMAADGSDLRKVGEPQDSEFYPALLDDGRILYTRWDYVMKAYNVIQPLWTVFPDGRRSQLAYGEWYAFSRGPIALFEARQIPGTRQVVAVGAAHHNTGVGPIMVVDLDKNRQGPSGMVNLTPWVGYPECGAMFDERTDRSLPDHPLISNTASPGGWYASPQPLDDGHFLVSFSFEKSSTARAAFGIYLIDRFGNQELIHRAADASCYAPQVLAPRPVPPAIPDLVRGIDPATPGRLMMQDVNEGLDGIPRGEAKFLRVVEVYTKNRHTDPHRCDAGVSSGYDLRGVLGTVPIEDDGSAFFEVPSGRLILLEALDGNHLELQRMRNYMNLMPGETQSCIGCHEVPGRSPAKASRVAKALRHGPVAITPPPWGAGPMGYRRVVQPVLDRHCVGCHDGGKGTDHASDLRGLALVTAPTAYDHDEGPQHLVSDGFLTLIKQVTYVKVGGYQGAKLPFTPGASGSRASPLMQLLAKGHHGVHLPAADWQALAAWIDCNAPYFSSYDDVETPRSAQLLREPTAQDRAAIAARTAQLAADGRRVVAYLAGGLETRSAGAGPVMLAQTSGQGWSSETMARVEGIPDTQRQLTFGGSRLAFSITGLDPARHYALCLSWWDCDGAGRRQSVVATVAGVRRTLLEARDLPVWHQRQERPATVEVALPVEVSTQGRCAVQVVKEAGANCVVSEAWIEER